MLRTLLKITGVVLLVLIVAVAGVVAYYSSGTPTTEPIAGDRTIATLEQVRVGDSLQWITVRGVDRNAPVLLYLHAGPGVSVIGMADFTRDLEQHFVVVHWDQRGAGKSCSGTGLSGRDFFETITADAADLVAQLKKRFADRPIYLVGHASGAAVGALLARDHPELVAGLVMVTPLVDTVANEEAVLAWLRARAQETGNQEMQGRLAQVSVPYANKDVFFEVHRYLADLGGDSTTGKGITPMLISALTSPEYSLHDKLSWFRCLEDSVDAAFSSIWKLRLAESVPSLEVPVWVVLGAKDHATSPDLVRAYYESLRAPKKELIILDDSAHFPMFEQSQEFNRLVVSRLLGR